MFLLIVGVLFLVGLILAYLARKISPNAISLEGRHVVITGGSSGIGKAIAIEAARRGANVTILARNKLRLEEAKTEIQKNLKTPENKVQCISVDLSSDYAAVESAIKQAEEKLGPVTIVINSAGSSISGRFQDIKADEFKRQMEINYLSAVYTTKAVIPSMMNLNQGRVVFVSSQAGQIGLFGYSAYSPSKFALRGLAESLQMEMAPYNIRVTVSFPPDTDTPGFQHELSGKPKETMLISETAGLLKSEEVANKILADCLAGNFQCCQGLDGWMLGHLTCGMSPITSLADLLQQGVLMGLFRIVSSFYLATFNNIVAKCKKERDEQKLKQS